MLNPFLFINIIYLLSIRNGLLDMTINNPIFIFSVITVIWFIPGLIVRRINETKLYNKKKKSQEDAIKKLYPKEKSKQ